MEAKMGRKIGMILLLGLVTAACGGGASGSELASLSGVIEGDGSSTVAPISQGIAEEFLREAPNVQVPVGTSGTGGGFEKFCRGETDFSDASRPIKDEEVQACAKAGIEFEEFQVAVDGLTVIVHPTNDFAECLTVEELGTIWGPKAEGKIDNWSQVRDGFPNKPLKLFGPGSDSGTFDYFTDAINGEEGAQRSDYGNIGEDDNAALRGVEGSPNAMAYFGYAFYINNTDKVKAVSIAPEGATCPDGGVAPSDETVKSGTYTPLSRPLFVYVRKDSLERPEVATFMEFYLDTVNSIIGEVGYVPMDDATLAEQKSKLQAAIG